MQTDRPQKTNWLQTHPNLVFWASFVVLNSLLFAPMYLLNQEGATLVPGPELFKDGYWVGINQLFVWRENPDPFRFSLELTIVAALWACVAWVRRRWLRWLVLVVYIVALAYYVYEAIVVSIYAVDPVFYSQYYLARDGLPFLAGHVRTAWWLLPVALAGLILTGTALWMLVGALLSSAASPRLRSMSRVAIATLAVLGLVASAVYQHYTATPGMVVSSVAAKVQQNVAASMALAADIARFDDTTVQQQYYYSRLKLTRQPNIYFIFIESYGSVLYLRPDFRQAYTAVLNDLEDQLRIAGWRATTALSDSPMWGGGSWMAYTSVLFGLRIDNQPQYLSLFNKYQVHTYPSLGRTLQDQGYEYTWLSSLEEDYVDKVWAKYERFYGVDKLVRNKDLDYVGPRFGWGPALPDQYTLNFAEQQLAAATDQPRFLFTITQNSHYPWTPHPVLVDDWRTLNQVQEQTPTTDPDSIEHAARRANYLHAVDYQLRMLTKFIMENGDDNSIFVLIGDHQPPGVSRRSEGWATPVHVIAKDPALIDAFAPYGFESGLEVARVQSALRHEGIYSLFMRLLYQAYGDQRMALPPYLPTGAIAAPVAHSGPDTNGSTSLP
ncbi:MAG: sulfatase-like hydrolase/transferase [Anaerolineales bacterium]|nr:sulfatase-like hydrolase/transferase [Anaerolineales bacterium]